MRTSIRDRFDQGPIVCPTCGYDLRGGGRSSRCPECGSQIAHDSSIRSDLDIHHTIESGGLERLAPWLKGSVLVLGGFLALHPFLAVGVAVAMVAVCGYRIVATLGFLRGGLVPLASRSIRIAFFVFLITDIVGLMIGMGMIAGIQLAPAALRPSIWGLGTLAWVAASLLGLLTITGTSAARLVSENRVIAGGVAWAATATLGVVASAFGLVIGIGLTTLGMDHWPFFVLALLWGVGLAGLGLALLGVRFTLDQLNDGLVYDLVDRSHARDIAALRTPTASRRVEESDIPLEPSN